MSLRIDKDAFSAGQIESKIWAAEELEKLFAHTYNLRITILGGWYGLLHFILKIRNKQSIEWCRSYDIDASACSIANSINNTWEKDQWRFRSWPKDANTVDYQDGTNCVINTATEHFHSNDWFHKIPEGTICLLQACDLDIDDHINKPSSLEDFILKYPLATTLFQEQKEFDFGNVKYKRYMIIGHK